MDRTVGFKTHLTPQAMPGYVLLHAEHASFMLQGDLYLALLPLLDGTKTRQQIVRALSPAQPPENVLFALDRLEQAGYVDEINPELPLADTTFWHGMGASAGDVVDRRGPFKIQCLDLSEDAGEAISLARLLQANGLTVSSDEPDLTVLVTDDYLGARTVACGHELEDRGASWMLVNVTGQAISIGPLFRPTSHRSFGDLEWCLRHNRRAYRMVDAFPAPLRRGSLPSTRQLGVALATTEITKAIVLDQLEVFERHLVTLEVSTLDVQRHTLRPRPPEPVDTSSMEPPPVTLQSRIKRYVSDGGHRQCSPDETYERLAPIISPLTGSVASLQKYGLTSPAIVYAAKQPSPWTYHRRNGDAMEKPIAAYGKGATEMQAKVSCLAEAVERDSCVYRGDELIRSAAILEMGSRAIHPDAIQNYSGKQFDGRDAWNARVSRLHQVPMAFREDAVVDWTPAWSISHDELRWLPTAFSYYCYPQPREEEFSFSTSNGCAAGNSIEEAILQGLFELVERDAAAIWWYNRLTRPGMDLDSFEDPFFDAMRRHHEQDGCTLHVLDLTSDLGIPTAAAVWAQKDGGRIHFGLGCHLDARIAISRALTELVQTTPLDYKSDHPPGEPTSRERERWNWISKETLEAHPYLMPSDERARAATDFASLPTLDLLEDIQYCDRVIRDRAMEVLVQDLTRAEFDFPVVRVTVPGLRHYWARLGPGRLYDVPVQMGWLDVPLSEEDLNPIPCPV